MINTVYFDYFFVIHFIRNFVKKSILKIIFFIVKKGEVWTSSGDYCLGGITRGNILRLCRDNGIPAFEKNFSLTDVYSADEAFVTGTFAGVAPVGDVDGRVVGNGARGPMVERLQGLYKALIENECR